MGMLFQDGRRTSQSSTDEEQQSADQAHRESTCRQVWSTDEASMDLKAVLREFEMTRLFAKVEMPPQRRANSQWMVVCSTAQCLAQGLQTVVPSWNQELGQKQEQEQEWEKDEMLAAIAFQGQDRICPEMKVLEDRKFCPDWKDQCEVMCIQDPTVEEDRQWIRHGS